MATTVRLTDELQARVDAARGDVPRERFVRSLLSEALTQREVGAPPGSGLPVAVRDGRVTGEPPRRERATGPGRRVDVPSSEARAGVAPRPKGGV